MGGGNGTEADSDVRILAVTIDGKGVVVRTLSTSEDLMTTEVGCMTTDSEDSRGGADGCRASVLSGANSASIAEEVTGGLNSAVEVLSGINSAEEVTGVAVEVLSGTNSTSIVEDITGGLNSAVEVAVRDDRETTLLGIGVEEEKS